MANHMHEWSIDHQIIDTDGPMPIGEVFAYCGCGEELRSDDIFRRVNATERLSAEDARFVSKVLRGVIELMAPISQIKPNITHSELEDYAAALEGEDENN